MHKAYKNQCTIVVSSCDAYEELWNPFFTLLYQAWSDNPFPIVLNTETKQYYDDRFEICCCNTDKTLAWGGRLKNVLKKIDTEYILFFLDDFWIDGKIQEEGIYNCIQRMNEDKSISVFSFMETFTGKYDDNRYDDFERRRLFGAYRFNCQAALWRRKHLMQYLRNYESPWEWETYGNWRSYRYFNRKFYSKKADSEQIIPYIFKVGEQAYGGLVLIGGKWYLPLVEYFKTNYLLDINMGNREVLTEEEFGKRSEPAEKEYERPEWKKKLFFLRKPYHVLLRVLRVGQHIKHIL